MRNLILTDIKTSYFLYKFIQDLNIFSDSPNFNYCIISLEKLMTIGVSDKDYVNYRLSMLNIHSCKIYKIKRYEN